MATDQITFDDGAAYERYMGVWSRSVGEVFLQWVSPAAGLAWLDVGCGNGAFTQLIVDRCSPASVDGVDPSEAQLAYARRRGLAAAKFALGDAMALPYGEEAFDVAVMPLVIFFVPQPPKGVAEMVRVVRAGGLVAAYGWDLEGGGFPYEALREEMRAMGVEVPQAPSADAAGMEVLHSLWTGAGLKEVQTREIVVRRRFANFEDYWAAVLGGPSVGKKLGAMAAADVAQLQKRMRARLKAEGDGSLLLEARANAVKGRKVN